MDLQRSLTDKAVFTYSKFNKGIWTKKIQCRTKLRLVHILANLLAPKGVLQINSVTSASWSLNQGFLLFDKIGIFAVGRLG